MLMSEELMYAEDEWHGFTNMKLTLTEEYVWGPGEKCHPSETSGVLT
jgi:hypothetical protein